MKTQTCSNCEHEIYKYRGEWKHKITETGRNNNVGDSHYLDVGCRCDKPCRKFVPQTQSPVTEEHTEIVGSAGVRRDTQTQSQEDVSDKMNPMSDSLNSGSNPDTQTPDDFILKKVCDRLYYKYPDDEDSPHIEIGKLAISLTRQAERKRMIELINNYENIAQYKIPISLKKEVEKK